MLGGAALCLFTVLCLLSGARTALETTAASKMDLFLRRAASGNAPGRTEVIVRVDNPGGELTAAERGALGAVGASVRQRLPIIASVALSVPTRNLTRLAALPFVARMSWNGTIRKCDEFTVEHSGADCAFNRYALAGSGVGVAVLDSGIRPTDDFSNRAGRLRVTAAVSFVSGSPDAEDRCGHGTHVAGIIGGNGKMSSGRKCFRTFYGIARDADLINVRVLDEHGEGDVSSAVAGIQWVVDHRAAYNIRVLNVSLGHPVGESYTTDPLCQAVEQAWKNGIVVVCAAGNDGRESATNQPGVDNEGWGVSYGSIHAPGNDPYVITVGAMKQTDGSRANDRIATYSSRGPSRLDLVVKPDLVAPGNRVISVDSNNSYLDDYAGNLNNVRLCEYVSGGKAAWSNAYFRLSGTSMSAPVVSGAAALLLNRYPALTPDTVKARLMVSADKWTDPAGNADPLTYGAGYLNIPAALASTVTAGQPALSPTMSLDDQGNVYINLDASVWGPAGAWGTGITDLRAIWGHSAIYGANVVSSSKAVWGHSVWSDRAIWGHNSNSVDLTCRAIKGE